MDLRELTEEDMNLIVWRYMPLSKFISLLTYQALWFSKLSILQDQFEGKIPQVTKKMMDTENQKHKKYFPPELHHQFDEMATKNERDSRELLLVNCWFLDEKESKRMWAEYGSDNEAVAIKSTIKQLLGNIGVPNDSNLTHIGKVSYVDHDNYLMSQYEASQGHERAFIKDKEQFSHEKELRVITFNVKSPYCVREDGKPFTEEEIKGKNMNNFDKSGLYFSINLEKLISEIVISPNTEEWFCLLIRRIIEKSGLNIPVTKSSL